MEKKGLGRIVNHDERSKMFAFNTSDIQLVNTTHERLVPIFDQGQVGSCTGNAGIGAINTVPFPLNEKVYTPDEAGAVALYSDAEKIDGGEGYPPEDQGSSGLSIAKVLLNAGLISGYQHTFTLNDALKALTQYPFITGVPWYSAMFSPDLDGRVHPNGILEGGHEIEAYRLDVDNGRIWFHNSWGTSWGVNGDFYLTWEDFAFLLNHQGDVTVLLPITAPAPTPTPPPTLPNVTLTRATTDAKEVLGRLDTDDGQFGCVTLENTITKIPAGTYKCVWSYMPRLKEWHYELQNVPGRTAIYIHEGNYYTNSEGCILLGWMLIDINFDGERDAIASRKTLNQFESHMKQLPFNLTVK